MAADSETTGRELSQEAEALISTSEDTETWRAAGEATGGSLGSLGLGRQFHLLL